MNTDEYKTITLKKLKELCDRYDHHKGNHYTWECDGEKVYQFILKILEKD